MRSFLLLLLFAASVGTLRAQEPARLQQFEQRVAALEAQHAKLEAKVRTASTAGVVAFLFGTFCALWAQNTGRNAWLWFFLGLFFSVITVLVLLAKNSGDLDRTRRGGRREFNLQDFRQQ
jgi:hypothetical protein